MVRLLRLPEVRSLTGLSGTTIWRREREGKFPRRRQIGPNAVAWRSDELEAWVEGRSKRGAASGNPSSGQTARTTGSDGEPAGVE